MVFGHDIIGKNYCDSVKMFGVIDIIFSQINRVEKDEESHADDFSVHEHDRNSDLTWVCFLPRRTTLRVAQKYGLLPREGNMIIYDVPLNLIASDPHKTREAFYAIIDHFELHYKEVAKNKKMAFWGVSVGTMPAVFLANKYNCCKARFICSTASLGEGIFSTFAAREIKDIALKSGFTGTRYDEVLNEINPIKNTKNLPKDTTFVIAGCDQYVPTAGGKKLFKKTKENNGHVKMYYVPILGHVLTIFSVGMINKCRHFLRWSNKTYQ